MVLTENRFRVKYTVIGNSIKENFTVTAIFTFDFILCMQVKYWRSVFTEQTYMWRAYLPV